MKSLVALRFPVQPTVALYLRLGLIFVFAYVPVASYLDPAAYYHYLPTWSAHLINRNLALDLLDVFEVLITLWLIWGEYLFPPAILSALALIAIVICNMSSFSVVFRNVAIIFGALALASLYRERNDHTDLDKKLVI